MSDEMLANKLREEFEDREYAHAYVNTFVAAQIATQIKVLREQRGLKQGDLADVTGMKQARISVLESPDYGAWTLSTLRRLAEAFDVVLNVSFETFGNTIDNITSFSREHLQREAREIELKAISKTKILHEWFDSLDLSSPQQGIEMRASALAEFRATSNETRSHDAACNAYSTHARDLHGIPAASNYKMSALPAAYMHSAQAQSARSAIQ
jgi:transcriptional regulator with XRE-family HTH domain